MSRLATMTMAAACVFLVACGPPATIQPRAHLATTASLDPGNVVTAVPGGGAPPESAWWQALRDPQLDALVTEAVAHRPDLRAVQARLDEAKADARVAGAARSPQAVVSTDLGRQRFSRENTASPPGGFTVWNNEIGVDLGYDLDLWGRNRASLASAVGNVHASEAEVQAVRIAVETAVVRAYLQLWAQCRLEDAYAALYEQAAQARRIVARRKTAGIATALELAQADTVVATSDNDLQQARHEVASLRVVLGALSGQGPGRGDRLARPTLVPLDPLVPAALPVDLLGRRPDIVAQRWRVESAAQDIHVARAAFYPNIDLVALATLGSLSRTGGFFNFLSSDAAGHRLGVAASLPLFDGGRREGQYGVAVASYDGAVEAYNQTLLDALRDVAAALTDIRALDGQVSQARRADASAAHAYDLASRGYRSGITDFLDVLAAQDIQARQEQLVIATETRRLDAWARLMLALGGGAPIFALPQPEEPSHAP